MAESTVRDLFRSLEQTLHERLRVIEDVLRMRSSQQREETAKAQSSSDLEARVAAVESTQKEFMMGMFSEITQRLAALEEVQERRVPVNPLLPVHPLEGLEVIPKREVAIPMEDDGAISLPDRLLLNKKALRALEAQEMGEKLMEDHPSMSSEADEKTDGDEGEQEAVEAEEEVVEAEEVVEEAVEAEEENVEEEAVEEEAEEDLGDGAPDEADEEAEEEADETEEVELEEFEYKGATYYRDGQNQVFMTDEDGELVQDPIGLWSPEKNKILKLKPAA